MAGSNKVIKMTRADSEEFHILIGNLALSGRAHTTGVQNNAHTGLVCHEPLYFISLFPHLYCVYWVCYDCSPARSYCHVVVIEGCRQQ